MNCETGETRGTSTCTDRVRRADRLEAFVALEELTMAEEDNEDDKSSSQ